MLPQTKVFVGSLPNGSKPEDLRRMFERFGEVTECDIMNRCGFIHMGTEEQAAAAIRALHNSNFNGGVITVEKGRIKERGARPVGGGGGPGGPRGGPRNGDMPRRPGGGGPMRGPPMGGGRDGGAPYMRDRLPMRGVDARGPPMGGGMGGAMRNGGGMGGGGGYDDYSQDRYNGYGGEDRRGFALMDRGGHVDDGYRAPAVGGYGAPVGGGYGAPTGGMYPDDRRGGYGGMDDRAPLYPEERRAPPQMYPDERDMMERRGGGGMRPPMQMAPAYDRAPAPIGNGDMFSRRSPQGMRGGGGGYDDPYAQQYPPMGRVGGGAGPRGGRDMGGMGPRRY